MKRFSTLATLAACDLGIGFVLQAYVLVHVGIGGQTDAHFAGQAVPVVLLSILQMPLQRAVVVAFTRDESERFPAIRLLAGVAGTIGAILLTLALLAPWFMALVFPELHPETRELAVSVMRAQSIAVLFSSLSIALISLNQIEGRFVQCELSMVTSTALSAVFVVFAVGWMGVLAAAYGQIVKAMIGAALLGWMLRNSVSTGPAPWRRIHDVLRPLISVGFFTKLAPIIDRSIASGAATGSMSVLAFGQSMYNASAAIAERAIVAPRLPALKRDMNSQSPFRMAGYLGLAGLALVVVTVAASVIALQVPAARDAVGADVLALLTTVLMGLAGFPAAALMVQWIAAAVVVLGRPDLTAKIMASGFLVGVAIKFAAFHLGGIRGLAIGISVYYLLNALAFLIVLRRIMRPRPALQ